MKENFTICNFELKEKYFVAIEGLCWETEESIFFPVPPLASPIFLTFIWPPPQNFPKKVKTNWNWYKLPLKKIFLDIFESFCNYYFNNILILDVTQTCFIEASLKLHMENLYCINGLFDSWSKLKNQRNFFLNNRNNKVIGQLNKHPLLWAGICFLVEIW